MRLVDLNPRWMRGHPDREGIGVEFDCPGPCCAGKPSIAPAFNDPEEGRAKKQRIYVPFTEPLDGRGTFAGKKTTWARTGANFETLSLTPSVDASGFGHWHGFVTNGECR